MQGFWISSYQTHRKAVNVQTGSILLPSSGHQLEREAPPSLLVPSLVSGGFARGGTRAATTGEAVCPEALKVSTETFVCEAPDQGGEGGVGGVSCSSLLHVEGKVTLQRGWRR